MAYIEKQKECENCATKVLARRVDTNHIFHFCFSILTLGLWIFIWGICILSSNTSKFICQRCGGKC